MTYEQIEKEFKEINQIIKTRDGDEVSLKPMTVKEEKSFLKKTYEAGVEEGKKSGLEEILRHSARVPKPVLAKLLQALKK